MSGWTLVFQVINFLVLALLLRRFLFEPVNAMITRRQEELERTQTEGDRARHGGEEFRAEAERALAGVGQERARILAEARNASEKEESEILEEARREAANIVEGARREVESEKDVALDTLESKAVDLAVAIAQRMLEEVAAAPIAEAFLERLCRHIDTLPAERLRALGDELKGRELLIATAPAVSEEVAKRWSDVIAEHLGRKIAARFVHDASLVTGVELRFPHTTLSFSWRDGLRAALEELTDHVDHR
jgi:F-type H+-transporting ATPase subunit b